MLLKTALEKEGKWTAAEITGALLQGKVWRYIPDKVTLVSKVTAVMLDYKDVVDSQNQLPFQESCSCPARLTVRSVKLTCSLS